METKNQEMKTDKPKILPCLLWKFLWGSSKIDMKTKIYTNKRNFSLWGLQHEAWLRNCQSFRTVKCLLHFRFLLESRSFCSSSIPPLHHSPFTIPFFNRGLLFPYSTETCSERHTISSDCLLVCISFALSLVFYIVVHPSSWNCLLIWPYHNLPLSPPSQIGPFPLFAGFVHSLLRQISIICLLFILISFSYSTH